jgi:intracellular sulfur oxidation DsrE/DsrF family protein
MKSGRRINNTSLCELLDGELSAAEHQRVLGEVRNNPGLRQRLHEYRRVRDLVRAAFLEDSAPRASRFMPRPSFRQSVAAGVLLVLGFAVGWSTHQSPGADSLSLSPNSLHTLAQPIGAHARDLRAILHVSSPDPGNMESALDEAENLLSSYRKEHKKLQLEIIANSGGLNLLRSDVSRFRHRIAMLQKKYPNVSFLACKRTLERLKLEKKINPHLLPGVHVVPSALDQILLRLNEGWVYVKA